jgi:hypothetical protein
MCAVRDASSEHAVSGALSEAVKEPRMAHFTGRSRSGSWHCERWFRTIYRPD